MKVRFMAMALAILLSSATAYAQVQSADQQKCFKAGGLATFKVGLAQSKSVSACLKDASGGDLPLGQTGQQCLAADNDGKVDKATTKALGVIAKKCATPPDFGWLGGAAAAAGGRTGSLTLFADLFGADFDAAVIDASDSDGAKCQKVVVKVMTKALKIGTQVINACQKDGLKSKVSPIDSLAGLRDCAAALNSDPQGKLAVLIEKLGDALAKSCPGVDLAAAFPGDCAAAVDLPACLAERTRCASCIAANEAQGLTADCDVIDNGAVDGSCCDGDDDGASSPACGGDDCDDTDPSRYPGAIESCDGVDNDCDGFVDEGADGAGASCGSTDVGPCSFGSLQCDGSGLVCEESNPPSGELCNGIDDDCDGDVDLSAGAPPADAVGTCSVPPAPPSGATSPCAAGTLACSGGSVQCNGAVGPSSLVDTCNVDANCDGLLTNQPDLQTDVANCGSCGTNCLAGTVQSNWSCVSGSCQFGSCRAGYYDNGGPGDAVAGDMKCGYACSFFSSQELCNGLDDDCDGQFDNGIVVPSTSAVCGASLAATAFECTTGVTRSCVGGGWQCTFPAGVCNAPGGCASTVEICDGLDNNCNGSVDEGSVCGGCTPTAEVCDGCDNDCDGIADNGVAAAACGLPSPAQCSGTVSCSAPQAVGSPGACVSGGFGACSAVPQSESCNGIDDDCDGAVDDGIPPQECTPIGTPPGLIFNANSQCRRGQQACGQACAGFVGPSAFEVCDGIDNDCDGIVDEGAFGVGVACGISAGPCSPGTTACVNGSLICAGGTSPQPEICDGIDNDCDGSADDAPLVDAPAGGASGCWTEPGACCSHWGLQWCPPAGATCNGIGSLTSPCFQGALTCSDGAWTCANAVEPSSESCDNVDNDCDAEIDEAGASCPVGLTCSDGRCE